MTHKKRKAFTLTELLVVVVIIGVLSAVVLPKFTKMLEGRKTTEAEEMMTAVRNEQEARCTLSKSYQKDLDKLGSYKQGKNFEYGPKTKNFDGEEKIVGMIASAKSGNYTLEMPSYADGRICCSGDGCEDLNKSYPSCDDLINTTKTPDFIDGNEDCGASVSKPNPDSVCTPGTKVPSSCKCGVEKGKICNAQGTDWAPYDNGTCEITQTEKDTCECITRPASYKQACGHCGTMNMVYKCQPDGQWHPIPENGCEVPEGYSKDCEPGKTETAACGAEEGTGTKTRTCSEKCAWSDWKGCVATNCEHGIREDGTCKEPIYAWRFDSKGNYSIPACEVNQTNNPGKLTSDYVNPMPATACVELHCPDSEGHTITSPLANRRFCNGCNEETGPHYCMGAVTSSVKSYLPNYDRYNYCNYTVFECIKYVATYK